FGYAEYRWAFILWVWNSISIRVRASVEQRKTRGIDTRILFIIYPVLSGIGNRAPMISFHTGYCFAGIKFIIDTISICIRDWTTLLTRKSRNRWTFINIIINPIFVCIGTNLLFKLHTPVQSDMQVRLTGIFKKSRYDTSGTDEERSYSKSKAGIELRE